MKTETKVGLLALAALILVLVFASMMGSLSPFSRGRSLDVVYNYAGGIDEGSPVRVMGINVGKVRAIRFEPGFKMPDGEEVKLRLTISVDQKAWSSIRTDSRFYINMAGVIGEKFLEISPGSLDQPEFADGAVVRGEDPPRVDQLISQSYGLAGKLINLLEKNEGSVSNVIQQVDRLTTNFNKTLSLLDKTSKNKEMARLLDNAIKISDDMAYLTGSLRSKKAEESYHLMHKLLFRLEPLDGPAIRKFLQEEGVRARVF
ncbi:MAG: MCE family protein [Bdellovibrionaceae bacterium]|nr:MCE family protein [Pseudobdellovibrionaceae bacterium]